MCEEEQAGQPCVPPAVMAVMTRVIKRLRVLVPLLLVTVMIMSALYLFCSLQFHEVKPSRNIQCNHEAAGMKQQVVLWTMMRSGSRVTQEMLTVLPCSFLTEEPLRQYRQKGAEFAVQLLKDIFQCHFSRQPDYFSQWINGSFPNEQEVTLVMCTEFPWLCRDAGLTDAMCEASCLRLVRVAAIQLDMARTLLEDPTLTIRVVHLVRDPRALIASRHKLQSLYNGINFNVYQDDEINSTLICDRYIHDLDSARFLARHHPSRYTLLRYEDLALHPQKEVRRLYNFLNLPYTAQVANTVATRTLGIRKDEHGTIYPYSAYKNSSATVFAWQDQMGFSEVTRLQQECGAVLKAYGYRTFPTLHHYHDPHNTPLLPLPPLL